MEPFDLDRELGDLPVPRAPRTLLPRVLAAALHHHGRVREEPFEVGKESGKKAVLRLLGGGGHDDPALGQYIGRRGLAQRHAQGDGPAPDRLRHHRRGRRTGVSQL